jgi:hypothetical protein
MSNTTKETETWTFPEGTTIRERVVAVLTMELRKASESAAYNHAFSRDIAISIVETLGELARTAEARL